MTPSGTGSEDDAGEKAEPAGVARDRGSPSALDASDTQAANARRTGALLCSAMLLDWYGVSGLAGDPYPPGELSDDDLTDFQRRLVKCMPLDSLIIQLWDWDVQFQDLLGEDWFFSAAFGGPETADECASELEELFLAKAAEFGIDLGVIGMDEEQELAGNAAMDFVLGWRARLRTRFTLGSSSGPRPR
jgi:hypothetical protein